MQKGEPIQIERVANGFIVRPTVVERNTVVSSDTFMVFQRLDLSRSRLIDDPPTLIEFLSDHFGGG